MYPYDFTTTAASDRIAQLHVARSRHRSSPPRWLQWLRERPRPVRNEAPAPGPSLLGAVDEIGAVDRQGRFSV
jgi:hypothetical protein